MSTFAPPARKKVLRKQTRSMESIAFRLPGPAIAVRKGAAVEKSVYKGVAKESLSPIEVPPWRTLDPSSWRERESLYPSSRRWDCLHESGGLCGCDEHVVRQPETTKEAWELMYFNKHGKWADIFRQSWFDSEAYEPYEPSSGPPYSPTSPAHSPSSPAYSPSSPVYEPL